VVLTDIGGIAGCGIGLVANLRADGERRSALGRQGTAAVCTALPDAWLWVEGYCLDTLCALAH
jgi:hypothetical protein